MLGALGILAYVASMMTHEAFGHGVACIIAGGHNVAMSGWNEGCDLNPEPLAITAAGPVVQFAGGLLAWLALRTLPARGFAALRSVLWLYMAFDLLISSGYIAFSGVADFGDSAVLIAGLSPHYLWRALLILIGAVIYYFSVWAALLELGRFVGSDERNRRLKRFVRIPYLAAGVFACCAGALNKTMTPGLAVGLALASSFGAGIGMVRLPYLRAASRLKASVPGFHVTRNIGWIVVAAVLGAIFLVILGPGLGAQNQ
jgi:hypothetical protein